jgi:superfamily I DNA and/or RNA helicase
MNDRTPEQINHNIDQTLAICAETSRNLTKLELLVQDFIASAKPRLLSLETSREQDEERLEELENNRVRMERAHLEHQERMNGMAATAERAHLEHQERMNSMAAIAEQSRLEHQERMNSMERAHLEHQSRIDRQDRLIELLTRQTGTSDPLD